ncbi:hypothetical protein CUMW_035200 [Citrus unshiu]|nr:hypothetical protein CUMW_035200 [Citrus unshiu]
MGLPSAYEGFARCSEWMKQYSGEYKTLDMILSTGSRDFCKLLSPLNQLPSQLRRNVVSEMAPLDRALTLDCVISQIIPNVLTDRGCSPNISDIRAGPFVL